MVGRFKAAGSVGLSIAIGFGLLAVPSHAAAPHHPASVPRLGPNTVGSTMSQARMYHTATLLLDGRVLVAGGDQNSGPTATVELWDPTTNTWSAAAAMSTARWQHTATRLSDGRVLVAGGFDASNNIVASAELYNPATNTWTSSGTMSTGRVQAVAGLLGNGKVLVAGGRNASQLASADLYDPATNSWSPAAAMSAAREGAVGVVLASGKMLVAGGYDGGTFLNTGEVYNAGTNAWTATGTMHTGRSQAAATRLGDGTVIVAGGSNFGALQAAEIYDPVSNTWAATGSMNSPRVAPALGRLPEGGVVAAGGDSGSSAISSTEVWNVNTHQWSTVHAMNAARAYFTATELGSRGVLLTGGTDLAGTIWSSAELFCCGDNMFDFRGCCFTATLLPNGKVMVTGGRENQYDDLAKTEIYDPATDTWTAAADKHYSTRSHTATLLPNGKVLTTGGQYPNAFGDAITNTELYDPGTDSWTDGASMHFARAGHTAVGLPDGRVFVVGGSASADIYDPDTNTWTQTASETTSRLGPAAVVLSDGRILVAGGSGGSSGSPSAAIYDPTTNTWTQAADMPVAVGPNAVGVRLHSGKVLVLLGTGESDPPQVYDPVANTWTPTGTLPTLRRYFGTDPVMLVDGTVLIAGGVNSTTWFSEVDRYEPTTNTWSAIGQLEIGRINHRQVLLGNGKLLLIAGNAGSDGDNSFGQLAESETVNAYAACAGCPGAPTITSVDTGSGWATVGFTPPANAGTSAITSYVVSTSPGGQFAVVPASARRAVLTVPNGIAQRARIYAINGSGPGLDSAPSALFTPTATSVDETTNYNTGDNKRLLKNATFYGQTAIDAQRTSVGILGFIVGLIGANPMTPLTPPVSTGPNSYTTSYSISDQSALVSVMRKYGLRPSEAQYFSVTLIGYLLSLGGH